MRPGLRYLQSADCNFFALYWLFPLKTYLLFCLELELKAKDALSTGTGYSV